MRRHADFDAWMKQQCLVTFHIILFHFAEDCISSLYPVLSLGRRHTISQFAANTKLCPVSLGLHVIISQIIKYKKKMKIDTHAINQIKKEKKNCTNKKRTVQKKHKKQSFRNRRYSGNSNPTIFHSRKLLEMGIMSMFLQATMMSGATFACLSATSG